MPSFPRLPCVLLEWATALSLFARSLTNAPPALALLPADVRVEQVERDSKGVVVTGSDGRSARFDEVVFACGAEEARRMLGKGATRWEAGPAGAPAILSTTVQGRPSTQMAAACDQCHLLPASFPAVRPAADTVASRRICPAPPAPRPPTRCRLERRLLGNVRYFNDLIVTHEDEEYMRRWGGAGGRGCRACSMPAGRAQQIITADD